MYSVAKKMFFLRDAIKKTYAGDKKYDGLDILNSNFLINLQNDSHN
jgi:hypothetical protein